MRLFALSSLDTLLSLLLVELTWWGMVFLRQTLPNFIHAILQHFNQVQPQHTPSGPVLEQSGDFESDTYTWNGDEEMQVAEYDPPIKTWTTELTIFSVFVVLVFLRLKTPLLLLIAVLKNKVNEHCQLIRIWYRLTIILDSLLFVFIGYIKFSNLDMKNILTNFTFVLLPFFIFRLIFWSLAKEMVDEMSVKGSSLFPTVGIKGVFRYLGSNVRNTLQVLLSWEILTNTIILVYSICFFAIDSLFQTSYERYFYWAVISPNLYPFTYFWGTTGLFLCWFMLLTIICGTTVQIIAVNKGWKLLMMFLVVLYIFVGFVAPLGVFVYSIVESINFINFEFMLEDDGSDVAHYVGIALAVVIEIGQTILKLVLITFTFKFFLSPSSGRDEQSALRQPLLQGDLKKETSSIN